MTLIFSPTLGRKIFYVSDADDDYAPMLELRFCNEFATRLTYEQKCRVAEAGLKALTELCVGVLAEGEEDEGTKLINP